MMDGKKKNRFLVLRTTDCRRQSSVVVTCDTDSVALVTCDCCDWSLPTATAALEAFSRLPRSPLQKSQKLPFIFG
jgi:hypothetical protein